MPLGRSRKILAARSFLFLFVEGERCLCLLIWGWHGPARSTTAHTTTLGRLVRDRSDTWMPVHNVWRWHASRRQASEGRPSSGQSRSLGPADATPASQLHGESTGVDLLDWSEGQPKRRCSSLGGCAREHRARTKAWVVSLVNDRRMRRSWRRWKKHSFTTLSTWGMSVISLSMMTPRSRTLHYITLHYITLHYIALHYITLHYITLHYITLHYITLHYITLHYITLHYITLHYITLHYITLHYITLHYITLHYITLHYITLHYITLHYITLHYSSTLLAPQMTSGASINKVILVIHRRA